MKEHQILFSAPMVRAILAGTKTQTRRVVKPQPFYQGFDGPPRFSSTFGEFHYPSQRGIKCPYGHPGDRLYVRETWQHSNHPYGPVDESCAIFYRADYWDDPHGMDGEKSPEGKYREWRPSIHMPRWASRILLEIVSVRVERLQDISEEDAMAEGADLAHFGVDAYGLPSGCAVMSVSHRAGYIELWESINGPGSWYANPWVWVVEFKRVQP